MAIPARSARSLISKVKDIPVNPWRDWFVPSTSAQLFNLERRIEYSTKVQIEQKKGTKILYDGECSICMAEISILRRFFKTKGLEYVDITSPTYDPNLYNGITYEDAMKEMHVIADDKVYLKADAIRKMYDSVGLNWLSSFSRLPVIAPMCDKLYLTFSVYRLQRALKNCDIDRCSIKLKLLKESIDNKV